MLPPALAVLTVHGHAAHPLGGKGPAARPARCGLGTGRAGAAPGAWQTPRSVAGPFVVLTVGAPTGMPPLYCWVVTVVVVTYVILLPGPVEQVVSTKLLPATGAWGVQLPTRVGPVVATPQVVVVQALLASAIAGVQLAVRAGPTVTALQVIST